MKKIILLFAFLCASVAASWAQQELKIASFTPAPFDTYAQQHPVKDINGDDCALVRVKIAHPANKLIFGGYVMGEVKQVYGDFFAWIPAGMRYLTISETENFFLPFTIDFKELLGPGEKLQSRKVYNLILEVPERTGEVHVGASNQYLAMTLGPKDANARIEIDGTIYNEHMKNGFLQKQFAPGTYHYRVSAKGYHTEEGEFTITKDQGASLQIDLKPAHGILLVYAKDESGYGDMDEVEVIIDGELRGTTPLPATGIKVDAGEVEVTLHKKLYKVHREVIRIEEGKTAIIDTMLISNSARVTLKAPGDHEVEEGILQKDIQIFMNGEWLANGVWEKELEAGTYDVVLQINGYERTPQQITVVAGENRTYNLIKPGKAYGVLEVTCNLPDAEVYIDGDFVGKTPLVKNDFPAGEYDDFFVKDNMGYYIDRRGIHVGTKETTKIHITATEKTYEVGDYYSNEKAGIDGVVIEVDDTGRHGKIVCLNDLGRQKWGPAAATINSTDEADGEQNMKTLELHLKEAFKEEYPNMTGAQMVDQMKRSYPAFGACKELGEGWYLPSKMEMEQLLSGTATRKSDGKKISIRKAVNDTLKEHNQNKIEAVPHWSSTEVGSHAAWIVSTAKQDINKSQKPMRFPVRAMARF